MVDIQKFLNEQGNGSLLVEINDTFSKVVKDCCDTGKKGSITLKVHIDPIPMKDGGHQIRTLPNVSSVNPKYDSGVGLFFVVTNGKDEPVALEKDDPRQVQMFNSMTEGAK